MMTMTRVKRPEVVGIGFAPDNQRLLHTPKDLLEYATVRTIPGNKSLYLTLQPPILFKAQALRLLAMDTLQIEGTFQEECLIAVSGAGYYKE